MSSTNEVIDPKKKKSQKSLKNVLTSPYNQYWFPLQKDDLKTVHKHLEKNLPALENLKSRISWKTLKKLSKENRRKILDEKKEKIRTTESNKPLIVMRSFLSIGLNETSRCATQDELSCLLVDGGPQSKRIAVFLVNIALAKHIPVLICPGLLEITMSRFGFKSIAIGFKKKLSNSGGSVQNVFCQKLVSLEDCLVQVFAHQLSTTPLLCDRMSQILVEVLDKSRSPKDESTNLNEVDTEVSKKPDFAMDELRSSAEESNSSLDLEQFAEKSPGEKSALLESGEELRSNSVCGKSLEVSALESTSLTMSKKPPETIAKKSLLGSPVVTLPPNIYRYRQDKSYRVYVPPLGSDKVAPGSEFIAVKGAGSSQQVKKFVRKRSSIVGEELFFIDTGDLVKPAVVKKVKPNPKRAAGKRKGS